MSTPLSTATSYGVASGSGAFSNVTETLAQIEAAWIAAGGPSWAAPQAAAIAEAESGGNPTAYNSSIGPTGAIDQSFGLWQINTSAHNQWQGQLTEPGSGSIFNPAQNAADAVALFKGTGGFTGPWAAEFISGSPGASAYQAALPAAQAALPSASTASPTPNPPTGVDQIGSVITSPAQVVGQAVSGAANSTYQAAVSSWSNWWGQHPAVVLIAGAVLLIIGWALVSGNTSEVVVSSASNGGAS